MDELKQEIALRDKSHLLTDVAHQPPDGAYGYEAALWSTGVKVLGWKSFGSYQGDWLAHVEFPNGERYFIKDYYGSCSGCDAFESDMGYADEEAPDYLHRLKDFGRRYLNDCMTKEQAEKAVSENIEWDSEAPEMLEWVRSA